MTVERLPSNRRRSTVLRAGACVSFSPCVGRVCSLQRVKVPKLSLAPEVLSYTFGIKYQDFHTM